MRITLVISSLECGGAQRAVSLMAQYWAAKDHDVTVITLSNESTDHFKLNERVKRISLDMEQSSTGFGEAIRNNIRRVSALRSVLRGVMPHLVVSFMDQINVLTLLASIDLGIPIIVSERIDPRVAPLRRSWSMLRHLFYRRARAVVVQTESVRAWATRLVAPTRVRVIPNAIDLKLAIEPPSSRQEERKIVAIGRLTEQKGFDLLLHAFAKVVAAKNEWTLEIVGDGPGREMLGEMVGKLAIGQHIRFVGTVSNPWELLKRASLFVLSSRYEGFPNAILEAMACGVAVISFDCPSGPREIIKDGVNGVLVPAGDVEELARAMEQLMTNDCERRRIAENGRRDVGRFTLDRIMSTWDQLTEEITIANCSSPQSTGF
jgi:glycosyltransferase involved in cell wall biosynthesis